MTENIEEIKIFLHQAVKQEFLPQLFIKIESHKKFLAELSKLIEEYPALTAKINNYNDDGSIESVIKLFDLIQEKLESKYNLMQGDSFLVDLESFSINISNFINESEASRIEVQAKERFYFQQGDSIFLRISKILKLFLYKVTVAPRQLNNFFLKLFKKPTKDIKYWNQKIPLRNLRSIYLYSSIYLELSELYRESLSVQTSSLLALKNYHMELENIFREKHLNLASNNSITEKIENIRTKFLEATNLFDSLDTEFNKKCDEIVDKSVLEYSEAYKKANTIELRARQLTQKKVINAEKEFANLYNRIEKGWSNTLFVLAEDWRMDNELLRTRYKLILDSIRITMTVGKKLDENVKPLTLSIIKTLNDVNEIFHKYNEGENDLEEVLLKSRTKLQSSLSADLIPQTIDTLLKQEILDDIDTIEDSVQKDISELSEKRALVKTDLYNKEIKDSEISYVSPKDMISFSSVPKFKSIFLKSKAEQSLNLQRIQNYLLEIDQISDFSLDSAQIMLSHKKGDLTAVKQVVIEGLERAIKKTEAINNEIIKLNESFAQKVKDPIDLLNEDLIKLTYTDSIFELKLKIARDRALQKSRELREQAIEKIKSALPRFYSMIKEGYKSATQIYSRTRKLIGFEKTATSAKGEVSNFLSETDKAINKLPFVYQRLFVVEPIQDARFFFGRDQELAQLENAYHNWSNEKFSPTVLYGEKGSGNTSLFNVFIKKNNFSEELIKITVQETVYTKEAFLVLFTQSLKLNNVNEIKDLIEALNDKTSVKKIIFLENLQHLFLRKINGFENLKLLI